MLEEMKKKLNAVFGTEPSGEASTENVVEAVVTEPASVSLDVFESLSAELGEYKALAEKQDEVIVSLTSQLEVFKGSVAAAEAEVARLAEEKVQAAFDAKHASLASVMGKDSPQLAAMFAATKDLPQESFDAVVSGLKAGSEALSQSAMFREVGVSGEADTSAPEAKTEESREMKIIRERNNKQ